MKVVELRATEQYIDKTAALRQLLYRGIEDYVMQLYGEGKVSLTYVTKMLGKSAYEVLDMAQARGIKTDYPDEILKKSREHAKRLVL